MASCHKQKARHCELTRTQNFILEQTILTKLIAGINILVTYKWHGNDIEHVFYSENMPRLWKSLQYINLFLLSTSANFFFYISGQSNRSARVLPGISSLFLSKKAAQYLTTVPFFKSSWRSLFLKILVNIMAYIYGVYFCGKIRQSWLCYFWLSQK